MKIKPIANKQEHKKKVCENFCMERADILIWDSSDSKERERLKATKMYMSRKTTETRKKSK